MALRDIGCEECGAIFPMAMSKVRVEGQNTWFPGKKCPICGCERFYPVIAAESEAPSARRSALRWQQNPWVGIGAAALLVVMIFVLAFVVLRRTSAPSGTRAVYVCTRCDEVFVAGTLASAAQKCPRCGERAGYRALHCRKCNAVFATKAAERNTAQFACPACRGTDVEMVQKTGEAVRFRRLHQRWEDEQKRKREEMINAPQ